MAEDVVRETHETRVGRAAGHAMPAAIDAVEHDVAAGRTARVDPGYRRSIGAVAIFELAAAGVPGFAATRSRSSLRFDSPLQMFEAVGAREPF